MLKGNNAKRMTNKKHKKQSAVAIRKEPEDKNPKGGGAADSHECAHSEIAFMWT